MMVICNKNDKTHLVFNLYSSEAISLESSPPFIHIQTSQSILVSVLFKEDNCSQFINPPHSGIGVTPVSLQCWSHRCHSSAGVTPVSLRCWCHSGVTPVLVSLRCHSGVAPVLVSLRCWCRSGVTPVLHRCHSGAGVTPVSLRCWCHSGVTPVLVLV